VKVGIVLPLSGPFAASGKQMLEGARYYLRKNGDKVGNRRVELIERDDGGVADATRRLAQELIVNDKVDILSGFGLTPLAFAAAPLATQTKIPMIVMGAATSSVTERSPYVIRTSFAQGQSAAHEQERSERCSGPC